jgi:hypothetical protein
MHNIVLRAPARISRMPCLTCVSSRAVCIATPCLRASSEPNTSPNWTDSSVRAGRYVTRISASTRLRILREDKKLHIIGIFRQQRKQEWFLS